jgi:hypothetical protein
MAKFQQNGIGKIRAIIIVLFLFFVSIYFFYPRFVLQTFSSEIETTPTPRPKVKANTTPQTRKAKKYSEFPHNVSAHKIDCGSCHKFPSANWKKVRKESEAFPDITDYPKHESCLKCHQQQFFKGSPPVICSICHINPSPRDSTRHAFPNPREIFDTTAKGKNHVSDFAISFPHDKHIEIVSRGKNGESLWVKASFSATRKKLAGEESCSVCHQTYQPQGASAGEFVTKPPEKLGDAFWLKKGTFKTVPTGHATCFTCHSTDTGILPAPTDCATCHKLAPVEIKTDFDEKLAAATGDLNKIMMLAWRKRDSSATFRHEFSSHADLECANCHNVAAMNTLDALTRKVPVTSCNMCHITETSEDGGILNFEVDARKKDASFACVKCHIAFGKSPIPESHFKAISGLK